MFSLQINSVTWKSKERKQRQLVLKVKYHCKFERVKSCLYAWQKWVRILFVFPQNKEKKTFTHQWDDKLTRKDQAIDKQFIKPSVTSYLAIWVNLTHILFFNIVVWVLKLHFKLESFPCRLIVIKFFYSLKWRLG